jgi:hypothetical protein
MKMRSVGMAVFAALSLSACVAYDVDNPALYDDPALAARRAQDPFARDPFFADPVYVVRYDRFGRPFYVPVAPTGPQRFGYWGGGIGRGPYAGGYGGRGRHKDRPRNEDVQRGPEDRLPVDPNRNVRDECQGENCAVQTPVEQPRDPVIDTIPDMSAREPCGGDPSVNLPGSEQVARC